MNARARVSRALLAALCAAGPSRAVEVAGHDLPCPTGSGTLRVYDKRSADRLGGYDSDLADYSSGGQWRTYAISTCSDGLYSVYGADATTAIPAARRAAVDKALAAARASLADPANPTVWERYQIAVAVYGALGRDDAFLAKLELEASWTVREAAVGYFPALDGPVTERAYLDAGRAELAKPLAGPDRKKLLYNLARIAERGGWAAERDGYLRDLEAVGDLTADEAATIARFRNLTGVVEPKLQERTVTGLQSALRTLTGVDRVQAEYTVADLLRRLGRSDEAARGYAAVAAAPDAPAELKVLANTMTSLTGR